MDNQLAIALSGQRALMTRLDTIAQNVANADTTGYRAETVRFETLVRKAGDSRLAFASLGETAIDMAPGGILPTGNPLDVAIAGEAFLAHGSDNGPLLTRDGRITLGADGALQSVDGLPVLDPGGAPLKADPLGGEITIARDGTISQSGRRIGALGLFRLPEGVVPQRAGLVAFDAGPAPEPVTDLRSVNVIQGSREGSNVDPLTELARLIIVTRTFDAVQATVKDAEDAAQAALRGLAPQV